MKFPEQFENRMKELLGAEYSAFREAFCNDTEVTKGIRLSIIRAEDAPEGETEIRKKILSEAVPWSANGYYAKADSQPGKSMYHEAGAFYLQEPSAMITAAIADARPGEKVLDLCAAPGGKATALGDALEGEGILIANEIHPSRVKILSENIERMGISNALVLNETPEKIAELFPGFFDLVVVDAPCSGEGMFRKEEAALSEWSMENVAMCAARQKDILKEAVKCLSPGGRLAYSTCTFAPAEDEENIAWLLKEYPELHLLDVPEKVREATSFGLDTAGAEIASKCVRIWPHKQGGEGHFAALLIKDGFADTESVEEGNAESKNAREKEFKRGKNIALSREQRESFEIFAKECLTKSGQERFREVLTYSPKDQKVAFLFGENLYIEPFYFPGKGVKIERAGLHLGTFAKNRFEPSLALARALRAGEFANDVEVSEEQAKAYFRGDPIRDADPALKGWVRLLVNGYALGFGKASGGTIKNHYPKGLRKDL